MPEIPPAIPEILINSNAGPDLNVGIHGDNAGAGTGGGVGGLGGLGWLGGGVGGLN